MRQVFIPSHITGFFSTHYHKNPYHTGSRGAGVCLSHGVYTRIELTEEKIEVFFNGKKSKAPVSEYVAKYFVEKFGVGGVKVYHEFEIPIGCGFGASGAGALGTAFCFSHLKPITLLEIAKIAHRAEIECHAGLGDVVSQIHGGIEIRRKEGIFGVVDEILSDNHKVVSISFGALQTKKVLKNENLRKRIDFKGEECLKKLLKYPKISNFVELSREFSEFLGLKTDRVSEVIDVLDRNNFNSSMIMLGESVFCFVHKSKISEILDILESFDSKVFVSDIWRRYDVYSKKPSKIQVFDVERKN